MAIPDISTLTTDELVALIQAANGAYAAREQAKQTSADTAKQAAQDAAAALTALLGPAGAPAGTTSIRAVLAYGDAVIGANPGTAVPLIMHGLETLTSATLNVVKSLG